MSETTIKAEELKALAKKIKELLVVEAKTPIKALTVIAILIAEMDESVANSASGVTAMSWVAAIHKALRSDHDD